MIVKTSKRKSIYRARVFDSEKNLIQALQQPDKSLGPPPFHLASSGRMNAQGISAFYGAMNEKTCIAEVRPSVGSIAVVAKFTPLESLKLLDLTRVLPEPEGSVFDKLYLEKCQLRQFLYRFKERISKPIVPSNVKIDYIITQAFADFLAASNLCLDGIIYPSVQLKGRKSNNIILFHKSSKVKELDHNYSMEVEWWHKGDELYYNLNREDKKRYEEPGELDDIFNYKQLSMNVKDLRKETIQIDLESIKILSIEAVLFKSKSNTVSLY